MMSFTREYLEEAAEILRRLDPESIEGLARLLAETRERGGRLFILGVGGSAANASHAVNDFRKLAGMEAYAPTDNAAELTARTNDEGWESVFEAWLRVSRLNSRDTVLVFSVGGGNEEKNISANLVRALKYAGGQGAGIGGIVGRPDGYTPRSAPPCPSWTTFASASTTTATGAIAVNRVPGCCSTPPRGTASPCPRASWWATAGATSTRAPPPDAAPS